MWTYNLQNVSPEQDLMRYLALPFLPCEKVLLDLRERYLFFLKLHQDAPKCVLTSYSEFRIECLFSVVLCGVT